MSYGEWSGDHDSVRNFARAVSSSIYYARQVGKERAEWGKAWYDEVTMLRSTGSARAFIERSMILIEQGKKINPLIGSEIRGENFKPQSLFTCIGNKRSDFETFRDLFRMYLVQEDGPHKIESDKGSPGDSKEPIGETE